MRYASFDNTKRIVRAYGIDIWIGVAKEVPANAFS